MAFLTWVFLWCQKYRKIKAKAPKIVSIFGNKSPRQKKTTCWQKKYVFAEMLMSAQWLCFIVEIKYLAKALALYRLLFIHIWFVLFDSSFVFVFLFFAAGVSHQQQREIIFRCNVVLNNKSVNEIHNSLNRTKHLTVHRPLSWSLK